MSSVVWFPGDTLRTEEGQTVSVWVEVGAATSSFIKPVSSNALIDIQSVDFTELQTSTGSLLTVPPIRVNGGTAEGVMTGHWVYAALRWGQRERERQCGKLQRFIDCCRNSYKQATLSHGSIKQTGSRQTSVTHPSLHLHQNTAHAAAENTHNLDAQFSCSNVGKTSMFKSHFYWYQ